MSFNHVDLKHFLNGFFEKKKDTVTKAWNVILLRSYHCFFNITLKDPTEFGLQTVVLVW